MTWQPLPPAPIDTDPEGADPRLFIRSVMKAMLVLEAFDAAEPAMGLQRLAERTGLGRSATQRFVHTLEILGYLRRDPKTLKYSLSNRAFLFVRSILSTNSALEQSFHLLSRLAERIGETVSWLEKDGDAAVVIGTVPSPHRTAIILPVGTRLELASSCAGLFLRNSVDGLGADSIAQGWAITEADLDHGSLTAAAPVKDVRGNVIAVINVSILRDRMTAQEARERIIPALVEVSREASQIAFG
ncbi:IclR family transcriptional regulator [Paracoccus laeviglucosivorans]|uniref:Transcriptional regulator, IclR family n=1 Tax=Paracoccus laeviglucosivorans TaxID=1197861 RepID=A0A521ERJ6_9RHOB|nr:helix-turn-helix domain-containing protein [Paracoccus laeviglucosivorans]SMO86522.1 transcriptional regulator, IclR family [Paracoccus laeviglucosivorans]